VAVCDSTWFRTDLDRQFCSTLVEIQDLYAGVFQDFQGDPDPAYQAIAAQAREVAQAAFQTREVLESNRLCLLAGSADAPGLPLPLGVSGGLGLAHAVITGSTTFEAAPDFFYQSQCLEWAAELQSKAQVLADLLLAAGDQSRAELLAASSDQLVNIGQESGRVLGPIAGEGSWCDEAPEACRLLQVGAVLLGGILVLNLLQTVRR
jgi:hypothetical protein